MNWSLNELLIMAPAFIIAIAMHEASHAFSAHLLGDPGPQKEGRLSLNPLRHLDPLGTIALLLVGFGWGKPVSVNPWRFKIGAVTGMAITALAGPAANLVVGAVFGLPLRFDMNLPQIALQFVYAVAYINVLLAVFNMIPLPPLDGFSVLMGILPRKLGMRIAPLAQYGPMALLLVFALGYVFHLNIIGAIIGPPVRALLPIVLGV